MENSKLNIFMLICIGIFCSVIIISNVSSYPLQLYPNGSVVDASGIVPTEIPLNVYYFNGSLYLIPEKNSTIYNYNLTNITNITCINCSNISNYTIIENNVSDIRVAEVNNRINATNARVTFLENKQSEILMNLSNYNLSLSNSTSTGSKWENKDTWFSIGIVLAIMLGLFCLGVIVKNG